MTFSRCRTTYFPSLIGPLVLSICAPMAAHAAQVTAHVDQNTNAANVIARDSNQPGDSRSYVDFLAAGGSPVTLPFASGASVSSDVDPDAGDDSASLSVNLSDAGFESDFSFAASDTGNLEVISLSVSEIRFSVDAAVVYTISGALSFSGAAGGTVTSDLSRVAGGGFLYLGSASGPSSPVTLGSGTGQRVGTLVAGVEYIVNTFGSVNAIAPANPNATGTGSIGIDFVDAIDSDSDGFADDGDVSGSTVDTPCTGGATLLCDDNCRVVANVDQADADSDGIGDACEGPPAAVPSFGAIGWSALILLLGVTGLLGVTRARVVRRC